MPEAPVLSNTQRREAYEKSLEVRRERAALKNWLRDPSDLDAPCYDDPVNRFRTALTYPDAQGMKVYDLLTALPGVGKRKATAMLDTAGIPAKNTVRACGPRQRERLFDLLR